MSQLLVYGNPKGKKGRMPAALKAYWAKRRGGSKSASKKSKKRRSGGHGRRVAVRVSAHRNPIVPRGFKDSHLMPAAIGAGGALVNDVAMGFVVSKLPASLQKPELRQLVKAGVAVGAGMLAEKVTSKAIARQATVGALTCILHDLGRTQVQKILPAGLTLSGLGEILATGMVTADDYTPQLSGPGEDYSYEDPIHSMFPMNVSAR